MKVVANQSLFDVAIQENGNVFSVFEWALKNDISITDILLPGTELTPPDIIVNQDRDKVNYFKGRSIATYFIKEAAQANDNEILLPQLFPLL